MTNYKLKIETVALDDLKPYEGNAKLHNIEHIKKSIVEFGFNDPIGIGRDNVIIEGHGRLEAARELGMTEVPCIRLDHLTDEQRRAYTLIHNQTTMEAGFDLGMLEIELAGITGVDMVDFGMGGMSLDFGDTQEQERSDAKDDDFDATQTRETDIKFGDVFKLGDHFLMCGDATSAADVATLMSAGDCPRR